jgi:hypothetical protein
VNERPLRIPDGSPARTTAHRSIAMLARHAAAVVLAVMLVAGCAQTATPTANPPSSVFPTPLPSGQGPFTPVPSAAPSLPVASPGASAPSAPSQPPVGRITADDAVALVLATDPRFAGLKPRDPVMIGQPAWYAIRPDGAGYVVTVTIGWGDCPAGCIYHHAWVYAVSGTGRVDLVSESGDEEPPGS